MTKTPNVLIIMADQLAASALPAYGHKVVQTPHLDQFAKTAAVFDSAYCNFPICSPSRASMMSGRLPHSIEAWDNAAEFSASIPTFAHYLSAAGYCTILSGKMHFVGPDQLHGFTERLTTDIYPSDFSWTPDWRKGPKHRPTGVSMRPVLEAGPCVRSLQIDYDDEVLYHGTQKIYDLARSQDQGPFCLTVAFSHPHPPFVTGQAHWDRYKTEDIDDPVVKPIPFDEMDEHSRWLHIAHAQNIYDVSPAQVRRARHAYYAMTRYIDYNVGHLLATLKETGLDQNTVVIFCSDHGEMLGERGMWFKQTFFEGSVRVPLMVSWPGHIKPQRVAAHVSLVDLLPTLLDLAAPAGEVEPVEALDGQSWLPLLTGQDKGLERIVVSEYSSEGVCAASRMVRQGDWKYIFTYKLPPMLFNLKDDPYELKNLSGDAKFSEVEKKLNALALKNWEPSAIHDRILASQKRRLFLSEIPKKTGKPLNWDFQANSHDTQRFIRGGGHAGPTSVKAKARFPFVKPVLPDHDE
ncbi:MAG: choline-sulfatase [Burkholderiaceae bacterium]|nr:choline-sulfatase [Burkholderiaceae bacterium]